MIPNFRNVHENVILHIADRTTFLPVMEKSFTDYLGAVYNLFIRNSPVVGESFAVEDRDKYPMLSITKFPPVLRAGFAHHWQPVYADLRDTDNDQIADTISEIFEPVPFTFRYELNLATQNAMQHEQIAEWLTVKYNSYRDKQTTMLFNPGPVVNTVFGNHKTGDQVEYEFKHVTDPFRSDGVMESLFELIVHPYVQTKAPEDLPVIQNLFVGLFQVNN